MIPIAVYITLQLWTLWLQHYYRYTDLWYLPHKVHSCTAGHRYYQQVPIVVPADRYGYKASTVLYMYGKYSRTYTM